MKEMKALEKIKDMIDFCDAVGCHRALYESLKDVEAELEALQQLKSCDGCKNAVFPLPQICFNCERKSADLYEAKDNA